MNKHFEVSKIVGTYGVFGCLWIFFSPTMPSACSSLILKF
jgi:hypothetical protein